MDADRFCTELWLAAPEAARLVDAGLSPAQAEKFRLSYRCIEKKGAISEFEDPLLDLITRYDISSIEIGMIRFASLAARSNQMWTVGKVESDPIILDSVSGELVVKDLHDKGHILWHCAFGSDRFLDALIPVARFLATCTWDLALLENQQEACKVADDCAILAGGSAYLNFYQMLVSCFK